MLSCSFRYITYSCFVLFYYVVESSVIVYRRSQLLEDEFKWLCSNEEVLFLGVIVFVKSTLWWSPDPQFICIIVRTSFWTRKPSPHLKAKKYMIFNFLDHVLGFFLLWIKHYTNWTKPFFPKTKNFLFELTSDWFSVRSHNYYTKEPIVSWRHRNTSSNLKSCLTDFSWIHLILQIKLIQYKIAKTLLIIELFVRNMPKELVPKHLPSLHGFFSRSAISSLILSKYEMNSSLQMRSLTWNTALSVL